MTRNKSTLEAFIQSTIRYGLYVGGYGVMGVIFGVYAGLMGALAGLIIGYSLRRSLEAMLAFGAVGWLGTILLCSIVASVMGIVAAISDHLTKRSIKQD